MPAIPLAIHQIWLGPRPIPQFCQALMETWKSKHPSWEYKLWTDADVELVSLPPRLAEMFALAENPAERSDILRLGVILRYGGLYVDVDFECLQPFDSLHRRYSFFAGVSNCGVFELNNGLLAAHPEHPLVHSLCEHVGRPWPEWGGEDVEPREAVAFHLERSGLLEGPLAAPGHAPFLATTGPGFFTRAVMRFLRAGAPLPSGTAPVALCPPELFYPLPNALRGKPRAECAAHVSPAALALHHWCRTWAEPCDADDTCHQVEKGAAT